MCRAPLRFPHLAFIPPVSYPPLRSTFSARKALSVVILFSHMRVFALMLWGKRYSRIVAFPIGEGGPRQRRSGTFVNCLLETISPALFHPAFPIQPPPLRGTSFHRKEGVFTLAPSFGRGCRAQRGGVGFFFCGEAAFSLPSPRGEGFVRRYAFSHMRVFALTLWGKRFSRIVAFPIGEGGPRQRWIGCSRLSST